MRPELDRQATMEVSAADAATDSDTGTLAILRDGFDPSCGEITLLVVPASTTSAILDGEASLPFALPQHAGEGIELVMLMRSDDIELAIEWLVLGENHYIRIVQRPQSGIDRRSDRIVVDRGATLSVASIVTGMEQRILLLEGAAQSIEWPLIR